MDAGTAGGISLLSENQIVDQWKNVDLAIRTLQGAGRKQVAAVMGVQTARSSTVARPFMRLKPQNIAVQVPLNPADAEVTHRVQHGCACA